MTDLLVVAPYFECAECHYETCCVCGRAAHVKLTCQQQEALQRSIELQMDTASARVIRNSSMQCPGCKRQVTKIKDCDHITCTCGTEFCYRCGIAIKGASHLNVCTVMGPQGSQTNLTTGSALLNLPRPQVATPMISAPTTSRYPSQPLSGRPRPTTTQAPIRPPQFFTGDPFMDAFLAELFAPQNYR
jgi:hypothetical protein